jgi:hypothetical protein
MNEEMIHQILHEDQWKKKVCTKFIPHRLMDEQKQWRHIMPRLHSDSSRLPVFLIAFFSFLT